MTSCSGDSDVHDSITDPNNPKCVSSCNDYGFVDELTYGSNKKVCTKSCKDLIPIAYIDDTTNTKHICTRECPNYIKYIEDAEDSNALQYICVSACDDDYYIDTNTSMCVKSCRNLVKNIYLNIDIEVIEDIEIKKKKCVSQCPVDKPYIKFYADTD